MEIGDYVVPTGVLAVELNAQQIPDEESTQDSDDNSQLLKLFWANIEKSSESASALKKSDKEEDKDVKVRSMIIDPLNDSGGKIQNKPVRGDGIETSFYSSGGGWDYYETDYYDNWQNLFDVFGTNIIQDGIVTLEIIDQRIDDHWNFEEVNVTFDEYYYTNGGGVNDEGGGTGGPAIIGCGPVGDGVSLVDWSVIRQLEGFRLDGYVPTKDGVAIGKSGVTVASGFDIGQRDVADLQKLGFSQALISKLQPYLGKTGQTALTYEAGKPLVISQAEAETINRASHAATLASIVTSYDNATGIAGAFYELPAEAQTVIASMAFQYGNLKTETPNFWNQIVAKDWSAVLSNLWAFGDSFTTRRHTEHALLKKAIDQGRLHNGSFC